MRNKEIWNILCATSMPTLLSAARASAMDPIFV